MPDTHGRSRTLDGIASDAGVFSIVAMDQRNTIKRMFHAAGVSDVPDDLMRATKAATVRALSPVASGFLLDPTFGVPGIRAEQAMAPGCGLLLAAEPEVRGVYGDEPLTRRDPDQDAHWAVTLGADAYKFFNQLRADRPYDGTGPDIATDNLAAVREIVADCRALELPVVIENLIYPLPGEELTPQRRTDAIIESARALNEIDGVDLLKLEYPGSAQACRRLADMLDRPWAVLSAGVPFDDFAQAMTVAFDEGGASGFIAGRSVWKETIGMPPAERDRFLADVSVPRLERLVRIAEAKARPWRQAAASSSRSPSPSPETSSRPEKE